MPKKEAENIAADVLRKMAAYETQTQGGMIRSDKLYNLNDFLRDHTPASTAGKVYKHNRGFSSHKPE